MVMPKAFKAAFHRLLRCLPRPAGSRLMVMTK
jgi:hypothetical protein